MKKNEELELEITDLSDEGAGIGKADGFTWFVKDAVIGDRVLAGITKVKKHYGFARLVRVLEPSKDRVTPACPVARQCGGCQLQALSYEAQLRFKQKKVLGNLQRIGGFDLAQMEQEGSVQIFPIIGMKSPYRYRNKAQFPIGKDRNGNLTAGFYAGRTHQIIAAKDCLLGCTENRIILDCILSWMQAYQIAPYDEGNQTGIVRHVLIRKAYYTGELMVCLVVNVKKLPHSDALLKQLLILQLKTQAEPAVHISSISYCVNQANTNVIMGTELVNLYGPGYITDEIHRPLQEIDEQHGGSSGTAAQTMQADQNALSFHISPLSFYQVNPVQMEKLYAAALSYAELTGKETVWDLYCGIGTISLFLARQAKKVYGVEIIPQAIENARENAVRNGISNAEFFVGKAEEVLPDWYAKQKNSPDGVEQVDVIVVDPPRKGCDSACLDTMLKIAPKRIVYVSCDCATLARDLKLLCEGGYALCKVQAVDQFPFSVHTETVVLLSKEEIDSKKSLGYCTDLHKAGQPA